MDPKSMRTIVKTNHKLTPLKLKKKSVSCCPLITTERSWSSLIFLKFGTKKGASICSDKNIYCRKQI